MAKKKAKVEDVRYRYSVYCHKCHAVYKMNVLKAECVCGHRIFTTNDHDELESKYLVLH